jgi:hypothetical protein
MVTIFHCGLDDSPASQQQASSFNGLPPCFQEAVRNFFCLAVPDAAVTADAEHANFSTAIILSIVVLTGMPSQRSRHTRASSHSAFICDWVYLSPATRF